MGRSTTFGTRLAVPVVTPMAVSVMAPPRRWLRRQCGGNQSHGRGCLLAWNEQGVTSSALTVTVTRQLRTGEKSS